MSDIKDEIINSIGIMVDKAIEKSQSTTTKKGVVTGMENGKYLVSVDGTTLSVYDSVGCNPKVGDGVFVQTSNGSLINAFITGLLKNNAKGGGGGGSTVIANPEGQATDDLDKIQIDGVVYDVVGGGMGDQAIVSVNAMPTIRVPSYVYIIRGDCALI